MGVLVSYRCLDCTYNSDRLSNGIGMSGKGYTTYYQGKNITTRKISIDTKDILKPSDLSYPENHRIIHPMIEIEGKDCSLKETMRVYLCPNCSHFSLIEKSKGFWD